MNLKPASQFRQRSIYTVTIKRLYDQMSQLQMIVGKTLVFPMLTNAVLNIIFWAVSMIIGCSAWTSLLPLSNICISIFYTFTSLDTIFLKSTLSKVDDFVSADISGFEYTYTMEDVVHIIGLLHKCIGILDAVKNRFMMMNIIYVYMLIQTILITLIGGR